MASKADLHRARQWGQRDYATGHKVTDCPYRTSPYRAAWIAGFTTAQKESAA